jgi:translation elongation factor EF-G
MNLIIEQFKDFNANLKAMSNSSVTTIELQKQFKDSLEVHFPTISDHREVWRSQIDELNQDIKEVYKELNNYFRTSTEQIQGFIGNNSEFITGINEIQKSIKIFVENSSLQKDGFGLINEQLTLMRQDFKDSQRQSIETNKSMIEAIIDLKKTMSKLDKLSEK